MNRSDQNHNEPLNINAIEIEARRLRAETLAAMTRRAMATLRRLLHPTVAQKAM